MHVPRLTTDKSFIDLDFALQLAATLRVLSSQPCTLEHEQCDVSSVLNKKYRSILFVLGDSDSQTLARLPEIGYTAFAAYVIMACKSDEIRSLLALERYSTKQIAEFTGSSPRWVRQCWTRMHRRPGRYGLLSAEVASLRAEVSIAREQVEALRALVER